MYYGVGRIKPTRGKLNKVEGAMEQKGSCLVETK
jgi:hypothetical protein